MTVQWHPEAVQEFLELETRVQEHLNKIEKLPEKGLNWEKVSMVKRQKIGLDAYRLKLDPEETQEVNHRIIFDITDDNEYIIVKLGRRPAFYTLENLEEAKERI